jgi:GNAT superfamily N-acetyltransferase
MTQPLPDDFEYRFSLAQDPDPDLGRYLISFSGSICRWDPDRDTEQELAEIRGQRLALAAVLDDGLDQREVLDSISPELSDFSETVLRDERCLLPATAAPELEPVECECLVYVAELRVAEGWRGRGIGSALLGRLAGMLDLTDCLIALKAFPLMDDYGKQATPEEIRRVKGFYAKHGFVPTGSDFMVKDARLCEAMKRRLARQRQTAGD